MINFGIQFVRMIDGVPVFDPMALVMPIIGVSIATISGIALIILTVLGWRWIKDLLCGTHHGVKKGPRDVVFSERSYNPESSREVVFYSTKK